eukprot:jgi/Ulvmu1/7939/UM004_0172.1
MADLPEKYATAKRMVRSCEEALAAMERLKARPADGQLQEFQRKRGELQRMNMSMETILNSAFSMPQTQKNDWMRKLKSCQTAAMSIDQSASLLYRTLEKRDEDLRDRESLLKGSTHAPGAGGDAFAMQTLQQSRRGVEEMLDQAAGVLMRMGATKEVLKKTHRSMLELANSVGISDRILKLADRRRKGDAALVCGGMIVLTVIVIILVLYWG